MITPKSSELALGPSQERRDTVSSARARASEEIGKIAARTTAIPSYVSGEIGYDPLESRIFPDVNDKEMMDAVFVALVTELPATMELETDLPGIHEEFDALLDFLPDPKDNTEFPIAASVVAWYPDGSRQRLAIATNATNLKHNSMAHAEMEAMASALEVLNIDRSPEEKLKQFNTQEGLIVLLTTHEPCYMCAGAMYNMEVGGVVYSLSQKTVEHKNKVRVDGKNKLFRTAKSLESGRRILQKEGIPVFGGYLRFEVLERMKRYMPDDEE